MATIGTLAVNVVANTESLSRGMKKARGEVTLFASAVGKASAMMKSFGATLTAGFAFRAIHNAIQDLDNLADTAARLGTSVEALSRLEYAGFMNDVSSGRLATALTFMEKNLGNNSKALQRFGLDVLRLRQLDAVEMFVQIADAINKMPTAAERTAAAMAVFGRGGGDMMELISKGRGGIEAAMADTPLPITDADIAKIQKADQAIKQLTADWIAFKRELAIDAVPLIEWLKWFGELETVQRGANNMRHPIRDWQKLNEDMQKMFDDAGVMFGLIDEKDTHTFRRQRAGEIAAADEFLKGSKEREIASWPADMQAEYRALDSSSSSMGGTAFASLFGLGSRFAQMVSLDPNKFLGDVQKHGRPAMSAAMMSRLSNFIDEQMLAISPAESMPRARFPETPQGLSALEMGSAAAFSQEKRSQQQSQLMDIQKKQLGEQTKMKDHLKNIDKNLQTFDRGVPSNIA